MPTVLVINSGSSSFKYQLIDMVDESVLAKGLIERIGEVGGRGEHRVGDEKFTVNEWIGDHTRGFEIMTRFFEQHGPSLDDNAPVAVGHRVVHGGARYSKATIVTDAVERDIDELSGLAPLHNPAALLGIRAARRVFDHVPHVVVFDTAFHQTLSHAAYTYAIDGQLAAKHRIRRYGFHGTSHAYVSRATAELLGRPVEELRTIVLHLGNGASACAVQGGKSVETSMGLTPLEGLVMGTRSGDIDPAIPAYLHRQAGIGVEEIDSMLNRRSGLLGMTGRGDMRDVQLAADAGDRIAQDALDVVAHRIRGYIGAYAAQMGGVDAIAFTAGIGENNHQIRSAALRGLDEVLGISLDEEKNRAEGSAARVISRDDSRVAVAVVPTDEEVEIARQALVATGNA